MAHQWRGVIREYADRLPVTESTRVITLGEGGTPLVHAQKLSELTGSTVYLKVEGMNPTGSFKDRGMTMAMTAAVQAGAKAVVCASTGNTSASAAAYATSAGLACAVLVPEGKIAMGKLSQAIAHGATLLQVDGNFDDCLEIARKLSDSYPVFLVNSVNPARIQGQKTAAFEIVDALGDAPDIHVLPVGNAGNISAYWKGYKEYATETTYSFGADGKDSQDGAEHDAAHERTLPAVSTKLPVMWGFQAAGAAPFVAGHPITHPETIATAIRIGNPASWDTAVAARDESGGLIDAVTDGEILAAHRWLSAKEGVFVEPGSAASVAGLIKMHEGGRVPTGKTIVCTVTGHGLKDPQWALRTADGGEVVPVKVSNDVVSVADALGLESGA
ncbi:threonine synthase [Sinomonas sp. ASV486]|uniref:threonine synthase n=1 Tax=Sinomonas sp. ASV486 TaxID=3051170 RepID=UPI0027DDC4B3|nr:threonine synthase [Sinomonas sp. ASV486]MDQ4490540.1 threonine synthase [Sinomonas sp. ASV486]